MIIVTLDGPSAVGKSTIAKLIAQKLNFRYLDTGAIYRIVALLVKEREINIENRAEVSNVCKNLKISMDFDKNGEFKIFVGFRDVTNLLRDEVISKNASIVSEYFEIRKNLLGIQRHFALENDIVAEGRDTGSVVFPYAKYKFYLDADLETRTLRRYKQSGETIDISEIRNQILERDKRDSERKISPLIIPEGAIIIDSSCKTIDEVVKQIIDIV